MANPQLADIQRTMKDKTNISYYPALIIYLQLKLQLTASTTSETFKQIERSMLVRMWDDQERQELEILPVSPEQKSRACDMLTSEMAIVWKSVATDREKFNQPQYAVKITQRALLPVLKGILGALQEIMLMRTQVMQLHPSGGDVPHWQWVEKLEQDYEHYKQIFEKDYPNKAEPSLP